MSPVPGSPAPWSASASSLSVIDKAIRRQIMGSTLPETMLAKETFLDEAELCEQSPAGFVVGGDVSRKLVEPKLDEAERDDAAERLCHESTSPMLRRKVEADVASTVGP